jgi:hypothetical protein
LQKDRHVTDAENGPQNVNGEYRFLAKKGALSPSGSAAGKENTDKKQRYW